MSISNDLRGTLKLKTLNVQLIWICNYIFKKVICDIKLHFLF